MRFIQVNKFKKFGAGIILCITYDVFGSEMSSIIGNADLNTGAGLSAAVTTDSTFRYSGNYTFHANIPNFNILAIDINGKSPGIFSVIENTSIGSIANVVGGVNLPINISDGKTLTLTGTGSTTAQYGFSAPADTYTGLGNIDFASGVGSLIVNTTDGSSVTLNNQFLNAGNAILNVNSDLTVTDPSLGNFGTIAGNSRSVLTINANDKNTTTIISKFPGTMGGSNGGQKTVGGLNIITPVIIIGNSFGSVGYDSRGGTGMVSIGTDLSPSVLTIKSNFYAYLSCVTFYHPDSRLILDSSNLTTLRPGFMTPDGNVGGGITVGGLFTPQDLVGIISLDANLNPLDVTNMNTGSFYSLGVDSNHRLKELQIMGDATATLRLPVHTAQLTFDTSGITRFMSPVSLGVGGNITLSRDATVNNLPDSGGGSIANIATISGDSPTINLGDNQLSLINTKLSFIGSPTINTTFDSATNKGGHITVDGVTNLDFSTLDNMQIILTANSVLPAAGTIYQYPLFEGRNNIIDLQIDNNKITFISNEQNRYITWSYNPITYIISSKTDVSTLPQNVANNGGSPAAQAIAQELASSANGTNPISQPASIEIISNLGVMSPKDETASLEQMAPNSSGTTAFMEVSDTSTRIISDRVLENIPINVNVTEGDGIAAGNQDITKYGIWGSSFYHKAIQKKYSSNLGYKLINYGSILGFDAMVNENSTVGLAWSYAKSNLSNQGIEGSDKANINTNLFAIYGLMDLPYNYFISGIASAGFGRVNNLEQRQISSSSIQTAQGNYDSVTYLGKILGGKQYKLRASKYTIIPMLGMRYSDFKDSGYQEAGASAHNLSVSKKSSYIFEAIVGAKVNTSYTTKNEVLIIPEFSVYSYINVKEKTNAAHISNIGFSNPVKVQDTKNTRAWYSLGADIGIIKNQIEYNLAYETQLDKKYIGHQGMFKVRVNF